MAKDKKQRRPKAETPKGFRDYFGSDLAERNAMLAKIAEVYHRYGFDPLETSAVETVEALGKFLPDVDRPNDGVFAWEEEGDWLALRYDLTAPLARVAAQYRQDLPTPYRRYAMGPVWRNEKPGPGRYRQFYQCDADTVGAASVAADAEIVAMLCDVLEAVGIPRGDYVVRINNRKVLDGVLDGLGIEDVEVSQAVLRTIDKFDKVGEAGVRELLGEGRKDASGAFIDGVGLEQASIDRVIEYLLARETASKNIAEGREVLLKGGFLSAHLRGNRDEYATARSEFIERHRKSKQGRDYLTNLETLELVTGSIARSEGGKQALDELADMADLLSAAGYDADRVVIDPSVVRGLGYYTGPVFEAELTFEITDEKGRPRQFGSVAGGGRYDDLVKRFTGQSVPATGISIGVDRLLAALRETGRVGGAAQGPVVVTVMDRDRTAEYMAMVSELRAAGIRAEMYLGNPKNFGNQLKYADKRGSPVAVIQGEDEAKRGVVLLKDLVLGAQIAADASLEEWKSQPAQREVLRDRLVAEVQAMLAAQAERG